MRKHIKKTVTIGICAYNEGANILPLLRSITAQENTAGCVIEKIIVVSDGSTDGMDKLVASYPDPRVSLVPFSSREGKPTRINYLIKHHTSDVLVLLDADILLTTGTTIQSLVRPFCEDATIGLVGGRCQPLPAETFIEGAINNYIQARIAIEDDIDLGKTAYCIHGMCMAMSKKFTRHLVLPHSLLSDDSYFYFYAREHGFDVQYANTAIALYRSPQTLSDAFRQSSRHHAGTPQLYAYFPRETIDAAYQLPPAILARISLYQCRANLLGYVFIKCLNYFARKKALHQYQDFSVLWDMIRTSKTTGQYA